MVIKHDLSLNKGKIVAGVGTPPTSEREFVRRGKPRRQWIPRVHEFRWDKSGSVPRYRPRGGAEFDENGPNLTEDVIFAIGTTLVRIEGPHEVQSSGIESKAGREIGYNILVAQGGC